jgi:hypothetical protein
LTDSRNGKSYVQLIAPLRKEDGVGREGFDAPRQASGPAVGHRVDERHLIPLGQTPLCIKRSTGSKM